MPGKTRRHRSRPVRPTNVGDQLARKPKSTADLAPDLWEVKGSNFKSNPSWRDHAPTTISIVDVHGSRVPVLEMRTVELEVGAAGIESHHVLNTVPPAPELWTGEKHHLLTHALRFLQVCCCARPTSNEPQDMRRLKPGVTPLQLLETSGLEAPHREEIMSLLKSLGLVEVRQLSNDTLYFVHLVFKAVGPNNEKFTRRELIDEWALPEFLAGGDDADEPDDDPAPDPATENEQSERLTKALLALRAVAASMNVEPNEDGWLEFVPEKGAQRIVADSLEVPIEIATRRFTELTRTGLVEAISLGPRPRLIRIKADFVEVTQEHLDKIKTSPRKPYRRRNVKASELIAAGVVERMNVAYTWLLEQVPEGLEPDESGFVTFEGRGNYGETLAAQRDMSPGQSSAALVNLRDLGVFYTSRDIGGYAQIALIRKLKLEAGPFSKRHLEKLRKQRRTKSPAAEPVDEPTTESDELTELIRAAHEHIDAQDDLINQLRRDNAKQAKELTSVKKQKEELAAEKQRLEAELVKAKQAAGGKPVTSEAVQKLRERLKKTS